MERDEHGIDRNVEHTPNTRELIARAQDGASDAREDLFRQVYPDLLQAARFRIGAALRTKMDTLDLAQTVYVEAVKDLPKYNYKGKGSFQRWLLGILENKIRKRVAFFRAKRRDMARDRPIERAESVPVGSSSPIDRLLAKEDRDRLEGAMDELSDEHREAIVNRYYLRMPWMEIGDQMGRSEEAAQMLCKRAPRKLRTIFERQGSGE